MRKVVFGFSRPRKWKPFAKLIMWADDSDISHGYTSFKSASADCEFIYQASHTRTNFMSGIAFDKANHRVEEYEIEVPEGTYEAMLNLCCNREGTPYDTLQIIGKSLVLAGSWIGMKFSNPLRRGYAGVDCIEEQSILVINGLGLKCDLDLDAISVKPFSKFIAGLPGSRRIV